MVDFALTLNVLINTNSNIRFAAICDMDGKILAQHSHKGIVNLVPIEETKKHLQRAVNSWKQRFELEGSAGKGLYAIAIYKKIKRITIPLGRGNLLFLTIENKGGGSKGIEKELGLVNLGFLLKSAH